MKTHTVILDRDPTDGVTASEAEVVKLAEAMEDAGIVDMEDARAFAFDEFIEEASEVMHHAQRQSTFTKTFNGSLRVIGVVA